MFNVTIIIRILYILAIKSKENIFHKNHNIVACNKIFMFWYILYILRIVFVFVSRINMDDYIYSNNVSIGNN